LAEKPKSRSACGFPGEPCPCGGLALKVLAFTLCTIPLAIMIGSTKAALREQTAAAEYAVIE
jgi:hypothetical protein